MFFFFEKNFKRLMLKKKSNYRTISTTFFKKNSFHKEKMCMFVCQNFLLRSKYN